MKKTYEELEQEVAALHEQLKPYLARDKEEARWREQVAKVEHIVNLLFPEGDYSHSNSIPKDLRHPEKCWWWNGVTINNIGSEWSDGTIEVELESYVGDGQNETYNFRIPGEWLALDDLEEISKVAHAWCRHEHKIRDEKSRAEAIANAEHQLAVAQTHLRRTKG